VTQTSRVLGTMLFVRSKFTLTALIVAGLAVVVTRTFIGFVPEISVNASRPTRFLPLLELVPIVVAVTCILATAPRLGDWERLAGASYRRHSIAAAAACILIPQVVLVCSAPAMPDRDPWAWMASNVLVVSAAGVCLAAIAGHVLAAAGTAVLFGLILVTQSAIGPDLPWLPVITTGWDPQPRWPAAALLSLAALCLYAVRGGSDVLDTRRRHNED